MPHTFLSIFGFFFFFRHIAGGFAVLIFCSYFLPTIIAIVRKKPNAGAILILNFFLGWTFVGWIVSLVWAVSGNPQPQPQQVIIHNNMPAEKQVTPVMVRPTTPVRPPSSTTSASKPDTISQLKQLKELLDSGVLTEEEFNQQKAKVLAS